MPTILEVLEEFPSCKLPATVFVAQLNPLQPRFYSISSSPKKYRDEIHITVAVVKYRAEGKCYRNANTQKLAIIVVYWSDR